MKSFKKVISIIAALAMLVTTLAVTASVSASAEDTTEEAPVYFTKFTADNFIGYGEYKRGEDGFESEEGSTNQTQVQEPQSVTYPADGAVDILTKTNKSKGVRLLYKLDDTAKDYFKRLEEEAEATYQENVEKAKAKAEKQGKEFKIESVAKVFPSVKGKFFINESVTSTDMDVDCFVTIAFVLKDGTLTDAIFGGGVKYATKEMTVPIRKKETVDGEAKYSAVDLNQIEAVRLEVYHWTPSLKEVTFSGLTVSGTGVLPEREAIEVGDEKTAVAFNFDKTYRRPYAPEPKEFLYCDVENPTDDKGNLLEDGDKKGFNKKGKAGWMKFKTEGANQQYQAAYWFDRDRFDYALAVANKKDENGNLIGSGKFLMTIALEDCVDSKGKPVEAEVKVNLATTHHGYITVVNAWQKPGTTVQYELDVSEIERSDVEQVIVCIQNYWYYDKDGNVVEYPADGKDVSVDLGDGETSITKKYGTGVQWIGGVIPQIKVSPITVKEPNQILTTAAPMTTAAPTTTKAPTKEIEGAGYHFFDFEEYSRMAGYGNQPQEIKYFNDSSKSDPLVIYTDKEDDFYGGMKFKSLYSHDGDNKQYQSCWTTVTAKATNDYKKEIETKISADYTKKVKNRMAQALAYAQQPGAPGLLGYKVRIYSAKAGQYKLINGKGKLLSGDGSDCTVEISMHIMCEDQYDSIQILKYQPIGKPDKDGVMPSVTYYLDVSDLSADDVKMIHPMAQNYAVCDKKTGNACGMYDIEVDFSALYVVGNGAKDIPKKTEAPTANNAEVEALYALYKQLPGLNPSDYKTEADWALLEKFVMACNDATVQTMNGLAAKGVTTDIIGRLQEIYLGTAGNFDDGPDTGAATAPIAAMCFAAAACFVFMKLRKK